MFNQCRLGKKKMFNIQQSIFNSQQKTIYNVAAFFLFVIEH